jgi:hypothetical protein
MQVGQRATPSPASAYLGISMPTHRIAQAASWFAARIVAALEGTCTQVKQIKCCGSMAVTTLAVDARVHAGTG